MAQAPGLCPVRLKVQGDRARLVLAPEAWPAFLAPAVRRGFTAFILTLGFKELLLDGPG